MAARCVARARLSRRARCHGAGGHARAGRMAPAACADCPTTCHRPRSRVPARSSSPHDSKGVRRHSAWLSGRLSWQDVAGHHLAERSGDRLFASHLALAQQREDQLGEAVRFSLRQWLSKRRVSLVADAPPTSNSSMLACSTRSMMTCCAWNASISVHASSPSSTSSATIPERAPSSALATLSSRDPAAPQAGDAPNHPLHERIVARAGLARNIKCARLDLAKRDGIVQRGPPRTVLSH